MTDAEERELRIEIMQIDAKLKGRQLFWETPRNIAIIVGAAAAIFGVLGFKLGQREPIQQVQQAPTIVFPPGTTITIPAKP